MKSKAILTQSFTSLSLLPLFFKLSLSVSHTKAIALTLPSLAVIPPFAFNSTDAYRVSTPSTQSLCIDCPTTKWSTPSTSATWRLLTWHGVLLAQWHLVTLLGSCWPRMSSLCRLTWTWSAVGTRERPFQRSLQAVKTKNSEHTLTSLTLDYCWTGLSCA